MTQTSPLYDLQVVQRAVLEEVVALHPARLTAPELSLWIVTDPDDYMEVETVSHAIRDLRRSSLVRLTGDIVEPTYAALRAVALLSA